MDGPARAGPPHEGANAEHINCLRCGYDLHGLDTAGNCPECGTEIARTISGNLLRFSPSHYLKRIQQGALLIVLSLVLSFAFGILTFVVSFFTAWLVTQPGTPFPRPDPMIGIPMSVLGLVIGILSLIGWWWFSEPDPTFVGTDQAVGVRKALRGIVIVFAVTMAVGLPLDIAQMIHYTGVAEAVEIALGMVAGFVGIAQFFLALLYIGNMAERLPDRDLRRRAHRYMWLLPLIFIVGMCVIIGPIIAIIMYAHLIHTVGKRIRAILEHRADEPNAIPVPAVE